MKNLEGTLLEGRYEVQEKLDGGSMATVYRAFDRKDSQPVAIKVLREDLAIQPDFLHRFRKEADKLKRLQHTNIVRLWEFVQKRHFAFISMEFIEGGTLQHKISDLQGFPMPSDEIIDLFSDVCNGLSKAHSAGIIHCDLKPANIMLRKDGTAVLTDFGIAREVEGTATMEHFGTATYMSPEQVRGDDPSPQFDIYALGVILFQLITGGYKPFTGSRATITGNTSEKIRWEQIHLDTPSPRRRNKDITKEMEALIFMCLNKDPRKRPKTAQQLLQSLKDTKIYSANRKKTVIPEEVEIVPPSSPGKKIKKPSQNRNIFIAFLTALGFFFVLSLTSHISPPTSIATPTAMVPTQILATSTTRLSEAAIAANTEVPKEILYAEDFEDQSAENWETYFSTWTIGQEDSNHFWVGTGPDNYPQAWLAETSEWENYAFEARVRIRRGGVFFCVRADTGSSFYNVFVNSNDTNIQFAEYLNGNYELFGNGRVSILRNKWYTMRFEVAGTDLRFYIDNKLVLSANSNGISSGGVGFYMGGGDEIHFDDMLIWQLD